MVHHVIVEIGLIDLKGFVELKLNDVAQVLNLQELIGSFVIEEHTFFSYGDYAHKIFNPQLAKETISEADIRPVLSELDEQSPQFQHINRFPGVHNPPENTSSYMMHFKE